MLLWRVGKVVASCGLWVGLNIPKNLAEVEV